MPREPVVLQVEREFYNESIAHDGPRIDETVFQHTTGQPHTYLNKAEKDALVSRYKSGVGQWAHEHGPVTVGQGGGLTSLAIHIGQETSDTDTYGGGVTFSYQTTLFGPTIGGSFLGEGTKTFEIVHGEESEYIGRVANLSADAFAENYYSWGLLAYKMNDHDSGQVFEVINYWVE